MAKDYNVVPDKASGDQFTEEMWDDYIKTNINNHRVPPACKAVRTTSQTITNATATAIQFDAADAFDTDTMHDVSTNNTRITPGTLGIYLVTANIYWASSAGGNYRVAAIGINGTEVQSTNGNATGDVRVNVTGIFSITSASDYFSLIAFQNSGGNLGLAQVHGVTAELAVTWLGQVS